MDYCKEALKVHKELRGKLEVISKAPVKTKYALSIAYTPGVAEPCREIAKDKNKVYDYTMKSNYIAVISDGTAVLGLGDIGPEAAMPVMEGKSVLFREFAGVNAIPLCISTKDTEEIISLVSKLAPSFGGINLEDISAPRCFEIEKRLKAAMDIPVFHDDQHGTAIVVMAGLINSLKMTGRKFSELTAILSGAGAAGTSITKMLLAFGVKDVIICDSRGAIYQGRDGLNAEKEEMAKITNKGGKKGSLGDVISETDIFIGVSAPGVLTKEMVRKMNKDPFIFAMSNPDPEIMPEDAKAAGARVVGTGRSDFPNQINNVLAFPGIFRGALDVMARDINEEMKMAAAIAIAGILKDEEITADYVIPEPFDERVCPAVAAAVACAAVKSGVARKILTYDEEYANAKEIMRKISQQ